MRRLLLPLLAVLTLAGSARAVELSAPENHARLRGGSFATLVWNGGALPSYADEWEAFLSIDGGRTYAFRITPHLDATLHRFAWIVPNVDARDARILIRFGNERRENAVEMPASFAIARDARAELVLQPRVARTIAEAARPGDVPVVAQSEGDRSGRGAETRVTGSRQCSLASVSRHPDAATLLATAFAPDAIATPESQPFVHFAPHVRATASACRAAPRDILTLTTRLNV